VLATLSIDSFQNQNIHRYNHCHSQCHRRIHKFVLRLPLLNNNSLLLAWEANQTIHSNQSCNTHQSKHHSVVSTQHYQPKLILFRFKCCFSNDNSTSCTCLLHPCRQLRLWHLAHVDADFLFHMKTRSHVPFYHFVLGYL